MLSRWTSWSVMCRWDTAHSTPGPCPLALAGPLLPGAVETTLTLAGPSTRVQGVLQRIHQRRVTALEEERSCPICMVASKEPALRRDNPLV